jgi:hypothetical protein
MAERKAFLLRLEPELLEALARWARDDLRSLNGQIEFLLRRALADSGRRPDEGAASADPGAPGSGRTRRRDRPS